jgi:hypothetical protein
MNKIAWVQNNCKFATRAPVLPSSMRKKITNFLFDLTTGKYLDSIPLNEISNFLQQMNLSMEDIILTGRDGRATIELSHVGPPPVVLNNMLALQWHKMDQSGKWEVTAYLT